MWLKSFALSVCLHIAFVSVLFAQADVPNPTPSISEVTRRAWEKDWTDRLFLGLQAQLPPEQKFAISKEQTLFDGTRVDLFTPDYAIEVDWSYKWAEGIGQSLHYGMQTDKLPGLILLLRDRKAELKYVQRCKAIGVKYGIQVWAVDTTTARLYKMDGSWVLLPEVPVAVVPQLIEIPK